MFEKTTQGAVSIIGGSDPLIADVTAQVSELLEDCLSDGQPMAVLDLGRVPLIDSQGLELLLNAQENFEQRGGLLKIAGPTPLCRDALTISGLADELEVYEDVSDAVRSFLH